MNESRFKQALRRVFWIPFGIGAVLAVVLIVEVQVLVKRQKAVERADHVIAVSRHVYQARIDEESALRAYLLTGDKEFLDRFGERRDVAKTPEAELRQLVSSNPEQHERNERAIAAYTNWSTWADQAIRIETTGRNATDLGFQLHGTALMDRYRAVRREFIDREEQLLAERLSHSRRTLRFVNLSVLAFCILTAGGLAGFGHMQMHVLAQSFKDALLTANANAVKLQEQKEWLQTTLNSIGDAVIATDAQGAITFMNPVAENLTGWRFEEATGLPLTDVLHIINQDSRQAVENPIDKVRRLNRVVGLANRTILVSRNGNESALDDSGAPIFGPDGKMVGIVLVFRDVTRQRGLEAALRANERLALAGRLSASIAHEIHNPLDTVGNLLFLLQQQTAGQAEVQRLIGMAQREVRRVAETSRNMLSLHRESRSPMPVKVPELIEGVVALIDGTIAKGKRRIQVEHGFEGEIEGFPAELRQVFTNVIKNAVEATTEGGEIRVSSASSREGGLDGALIQVTDNGPGISDQIKSKLFSPFTTTKEERGTGLGLWVSRSIVQRHGGNMRIVKRADSLPGTTVSVFLPLKATPWRDAGEVEYSIEKHV